VKKNALFFSRMGMVEELATTEPRKKNARSE
jgi:hypothetical protein